LVKYRKWSTKKYHLCTIPSSYSRTITIVTQKIVQVLYKKKYHLHIPLQSRLYHRMLRKYKKWSIKKIPSVYSFLSTSTIVLHDHVHVQKMIYKKNTICIFLHKHDYTTKGCTSTRNDLLKNTICKFLHK